MMELRKKALEAWGELAIRNVETDFAVNDWLEEVAGKKYIEEGEDPIWNTIFNLTNSECRRFLKGCERIDADVYEWNAARAC